MKTLYLKSQLSYPLFTRIFYKLLLILICFLASACAHRINITPDLSQLEELKQPRIAKNVGYYISAENLKKQVKTPAGGGDKVKYFPYKESEPTLKAILSNIFFNVYQIPSLNDTQFIRSRNIAYIFIPEIKTNSSSRSIWIWPPPDFTVSLACQAVNPERETIWKTSVSGKAHLGLPQVHFKRSLAGKVAIAKAFSKLQYEIHTQFYKDPIIDNDLINSFDSFDEGQGEYYSPQEPQKIKESGTQVDSFDTEDEYYSPAEEQGSSYNNQSN